MKARLEGFNLVIKTHIEHGCRHPTPVIYSIHRAEPGAAPFFKPGNARRSIVTSLFRARAPKGDYPMMNTRRNDDANNPANTSKKKHGPINILPRLVLSAPWIIRRRWLVYSNRSTPSPTWGSSSLFVLLYSFLLCKQWRGLRNSIGIHCLSGRAEQYGSVPI